MLLQRMSLFSSRRSGRYRAEAAVANVLDVRDWGGRGKGDCACNLSHYLHR